MGNGNARRSGLGRPKTKKKNQRGALHYRYRRYCTGTVQYFSYFWRGELRLRVAKTEVALFGAFGIFWGVEVLCQGQGESAILLFTVPVRLYLCNIIFGCTVQCWYNSGRVVLRLNSILAPRGINFASNFHDSKSNIKVPRTVLIPW